MSESRARTVHVVSLGCPKNRVDTELMMGQLAQAGFAPTVDANGADVLLVNTCAFIEASKVESVEAIVDLAEVKARNPGARLVVAGCLAQRHAPELRSELPEVDFFVGTGEYQELAGLLDLAPADAGQASAALGDRKPRPVYVADHLAPRYVAEGTFSNWLKIAEGCSQGCSFCIIPKLRGVQRSRPVPDLVAEARSLVEGGAVELNLIAQDLTHYGVDLGQPEALAQLVRALGQVDGLRWVRLMYAYPDNISDGLLAAMAETENCLPYLDIPLQHAADSVLKRMNRIGDRRAMETQLARLRAAIPDLAIRTTLLVGHPGEGEDEFEQLCDFVREQRFTHMGCFAWSAEEGTLSARMPDIVPTMVRRHRERQIMAIQREIAAENATQRIGQRVQVLVEGLSDESDLLLQGRAWWQAPEIDGLVYINDAPDDIGRGQLREVEISATAGEYDLVGHVVSDT